MRLGERPADQHVGRHLGPRRLPKRKNRSIVITATARKQAMVAILMLKNDERYRYARPDLMRAKFSKIGGKAPGKRMSVLRGRPRSGLTEVHTAAKLPAVKQPQELPPGERRMPEQ